MARPSFISHLKDPAKFFQLFRDELAADDVGSTLTFGEPRWFVAHRIMDDRSGRFPEDRFRPQHHAEIVANFDPQRLRVPVVAGFLPDRDMGRPGPGHFSFLPPAGEVVEVDRDRINLWTQVRPIIDPKTGADRIAALIAEGFTERSAGFRKSLDEGDERGWEMFHLALLSMAETPGIVNMPRLEAARRVAGDAITLENKTQEWAVFSALDPTDRSEIVYATARALDKAAEQAGEEFTVPLTKEDLQQIGASVREQIDSALEGQSETFAEQIGEVRETVSQVVTRIETVESKADDLEQRTESVTAEAQEAQEQAEEDRKKARADELRRLHAERDQLARRAVAAGRTPAEVQSFAETFEWEEATEATLKQFAAGLGTIPPRIGDRTAVEVSSGGDDTEPVLFDSDQAFKLGTVPTRYDKTEAALVGRVLASCVGPDGQVDKAKALDKIRREATGGAPVRVSL